MKKNTQRNRGVTVIYAMVIMTALCMFLSLAVDYGRAQLVKTELRRAADASARAAAVYIYSNLTTASNAAVNTAKLNLADGTPVNLITSQDIQYGYWDVNAKTFNPNAPSTSINAVHVTARRSQSRGTAVPMLLASVMGRTQCDVQAETIVMAVKALSVNQNVQGKANPFLSGMPPGSIASEINPHNNPDHAGDATNPLESPQAVGMPITDGQTVTFDSITGTVSHDPALNLANPDGDLTEEVGHDNLTPTHANNYGSQMYSENGIADAWIPIDALVGVFLDDNAPGTGPGSAGPATSDFRDPNAPDPTHSLIDFDELHPKLKQIFFIGDGKNHKGDYQRFIAPKGATRLFLATMDYYEWNNNQNYRVIQINRPSQIITVR